MSEERVIYQNHKESNITRVFISFTLAVVLMVMGWIGINVSDGRIDIARIQVQMTVANQNNTAQNRKIEMNRISIVDTQKGLSKLTTVVHDMKNTMDTHVKYHPDEK